MTDFALSHDERRMAVADHPEPSPLEAFGHAEERRVAVPGIAEVYAAHFKYVWRCLRALGVRDAALDDAVQDVFLVVQKKLEQFDGKAQLRTWLYAIALRMARRYRAQAAQDARYGSPDGGATADDAAVSAATESRVSADAERAFEQSERLELARRALERLDDPKREVFVLAHVEQMSSPEIAETIGLPLNTVYSRLRAARLEFAAHVARLEPALRRFR
jgi:RNA polymerase sigma-70 factor, ECF subfamily